MKNSLPNTNTMVIFGTVIQKENQEEIKGWEGKDIVLWRFLEFNFDNVSENYTTVKVDDKLGLR